MISITAILSYILYVILFSILFRYGIDISFGIDTGFIGPVYIFHSVLMLILLMGNTKK